MIDRKQVASLALLVLSTFLLQGQEKESEQESAPAFEYQAPVIEKVIFDADLTMLGRERTEYSTNLATYVANLVVEKKADADSLELARRVLALSLHLSPRNKQALVVNFQLKRGTLPEVKAGDYNRKTFSRLLLSRARLLAKEDAEQDKLLSRCFVELAATMDPRNEDAVFAFEIQRLDEGEVDWRLITEAVKDEPSQQPVPPAEP